MIGRTCRLEPLDPAAHAARAARREPARHDAAQLDLSALRAVRHAGRLSRLAERRRRQDDPHVSRDRRSRDRRRRSASRAICGSIRAPGSIEVGHINYSPQLQRTVAATEAMYLMMQRAFELGYRRYEWKCHALNAPSRAAAQRLGFSYEGVFRQARVDKGRNRDTAWYAMIDSEWPALDRAFRALARSGQLRRQGRQRDVAHRARPAPILVSTGVRHAVRHHRAVACILRITGLPVHGRVGHAESLALQHPTYQVDPFWPKPLPNHWIVGAVAGVAVDARDHVWITHRPSTLQPNETRLLEGGAAGAGVRSRRHAGVVVGRTGRRATNGRSSSTASTSTTATTCGSAAAATRTRRS